MISKSKLFILLVIAASALGFCLGATDYHDFMKGVTWTSIGSTLFSGLGFFLALSTYSRWLENKKKEDAYLACKNYLTALNKLEEIMRKIDLQYCHLCPAPGVVFEARESCTKRIEELDNLSADFHSARVNFNRCKVELVFWGVELKDDRKHDSLKADLDKIYEIMIALNNQLFHYYLEENENIEGMIIDYKKKFDGHMQSICKILSDIFLSDWASVFKFNNSKNWLNWLD